MATRYEARQSVEMPGVWLVDGDYSAIVIRAMTEAEAKITEFALNAVADGLQLEASDEDLTHVYDGPTEGVAP